MGKYVAIHLQRVGNTFFAGVVTSRMMNTTWITKEKQQ